MARAFSVEVRRGRCRFAFYVTVEINPAQRRETGGAGLGLAVARTVIRGHGGEVTLSNRPEGGLRQEVVLPRPE